MHSPGPNATPSTIHRTLRFLGLWSVASWLLASQASAALTVSDLWVRAMPPSQTMTAAYATVRNDGDSVITLTGASATFAAKSEIHTTLRDGDSVRMAPMGPVPLAPGEHLSLEPGGAHIMLMGIADMPAADTTVSVCLTTSDGAVCADAPVLRNAPKASHDGAHPSMHH